MDDALLEPNAASPHPLAIDRDCDVCVVGAGLAGLTVALEAARLGAEVIVLEAGRIGAHASGHQLGSVMPGFGVPVGDLIARVGFAAARSLWALSCEGMDYVRATAGGAGLAALTPVDGALEVSQVDLGDELIGRLQVLGEDFGAEVEGWQAEQVRDVLRSRRYFHAIHYPRAFQIDGAAYLAHLAALARGAGVRIFEGTPVVGFDYAGIRKRIVTPQARLRAGHLVLAGNVHLGTPFPRLTATLTPVWRYAAITAPLGDRLAEAVRFGGTVVDPAGIEQYRIIDGDRLMWAGPETTWAVAPRCFEGALRRRMRTVFPSLGRIEIERVVCGVDGHAVHGMPQIGELRRGVWVASGFGRRGLNTTAMAGQLIARGIMQRDDCWKQFSPYELVWAGGMAGRVAAQVASGWSRRATAAAGALARYREGALARERLREERLAAVSRRVRAGAEQADRSRG